MIKAIVFGGKERTYQSWYGTPESRLNNDVEAMETTASNEGWNEAQTDNLLHSNSRTYNAYTYQNQVDDYKQDHYQLHFSHRFKDALTANAALHYTKGKGYYEEYKYDDSFANYGLKPVVIGDSTIYSSDIIRRRWLNNDFYGVTYSLNYEKEKFNVIVGGAANRYDGDHYGQIVWAQVATVPTEYQYYFNNGDKRDFNIYAKASYQLTEKLNAFVDLQYRRVTYKTNGIENKQNEFDLKANFNFFNPKVGLTYSLTDNQQLYASYSIGNREPVRDDFVDAHFKAKTVSPKAETLRNLEVGYRTTTDNYTFSANYYLMDYKNQLVLTGAINDVGSSLRTNVAKSYRTGIELEGLVKISNKFRWNANLTISQNKIKNFTEILTDSGIDWDTTITVERKYTNTTIAFSPGVIAGSGFTFLPFRNADITLLTKYVGKQYLDNTTNSKRSIDAYLVNDVRVSYAWKPRFIKEIDFSFLLNNIFSTKYSSNGYTWGYLGGGQEYRENYYYPQAGRNFLAMITMKF
jgi:iron complex outermembrane receptor protein